MHPELSRQLFDSQVAQISKNPELLADRGWLILCSTFPYLTVAAVHRATDRIRVFQFKCTDWNDTPPAMKLIDAETTSDLPGNLWPTDNASHWHHSGWISAANIATQQPFMCMRGIREYHTHFSHVNDRWEDYKNLPGYDLPGIVVQVTEAFQKSSV